MELDLSYPSHRVILSHKDGDFFTKVKVFVKDKVYHDMIQSILFDSEKALNFVANERILLNGFLRSLLLLHNKGISSMRGLEDTFDVFTDEMGYYVYCMINDISFAEQEWFNTAYIQCGIFKAKDYIEECSVTLLRTVYPEFNYRPQTKTTPKPVIKFDEYDSAFKCNPDKYKWFLDENEIETLYHFSPIENVPSIKKHSICSLKYLDDNNIRVERFSSSETSRSIDKHKKTYDFVHLLFEPNNPMIKIAMSEGRLAEKKLFEVDPIVLFLRDTCYTHGNAASNSVFPSKDLQHLMDIPFKKFHKKIFWELDEMGRFYFQSEVLVKSKINKEYISNL